MSVESTGCACHRPPGPSSRRSPTRICERTAPRPGARIWPGGGTSRVWPEESGRGVDRDGVLTAGRTAGLREGGPGLPLEERLLRSFPRSVSAPRQYGVAHAQAWLSLSSDEFWGARATPVAPPSRRAAVWLAAPGFLMRSVITGTASSVITAVGVASRAAETLWGRAALTGVCSSPSPPCHRPPLAASAVRLACICPRPVGRRARSPAVARHAAVAAGRARPAPALGA